MNYTAKDLVTELQRKRFRITLDGEDLSFSYPKNAASGVVADARQKLKENKRRIVGYLRRQVQETKGQLTRALSQKREELARRQKDLASPYYADDEWTETQIGYLEQHIAEIERYLVDGGGLRLPRCCKDEDYHCLTAMRGFDCCIMLPGECGFALRV